MSGYYRYTYSIDPEVAAVSVLKEQPLQSEWGYQQHSALDLQGATYHNLCAIVKPLTNNSVGLIECVDGSVVTVEDLRGKWDPKDAEVELMQSAGEALAAAESKFFARQLSEIDRSIYAVKYPAPLFIRDAPQVSAQAAPTWRVRLRAWVGALRYRLGSWVAGTSLADDDCGEDDD
jgi:hypothetical protein